MTKTIRVGIIGSGSVARAHAANYKALPGVEIVGVADIVPGKAKEFIEVRQLNGASAFENHLDLLNEDIDAVSVCTPHVAHHRTTVDALLAGKHVLVEKPMCSSLEQAVEMVEAGKKSGKILTVGFQPRYDPNHKAMKEIVESGQLGKVYYVQTGAGRRRGLPGGTFISKEISGAGAIFDIGCYSLDMALNTIGYPKPITVSAYTSNYFGTNPKYHNQSEKFEVDDFGVAMIRLEGDILLNFKISWAMHADSFGPTLFLGTEGGLKANPSGQTWDSPVASMTLFHDLLGHQTDTSIPVKQHKIDVFHEKIRDFVEAIRENRSAPIPGEQIMINQAILDGILRSSKQGREVEVHIPNF
ncbi:Gfo/Idh/MocA family protein [Paenibacillus radicis (ex Xue et al. 2023)]|uniref:Gfo/Idh/MocA family oxidoreductase n=1 Tax=Paenibacillus radicis (ex Xue et al. 2023) TaxID=2972489 RepID=A0ABT1YG21_9BACL|nr:Gfo/Idh/MocA family oxidoreductase [Paenibacillus radicis (ex Xue et al. 2023)]MCR8632147.1 Gfo/Idh/MocA family oxidoreductase [Paenibacillus radicis (ex Xue et al. 2023)]